MMDIYRDIYYSDSALSDYVTSFYTGYRFSDYQFAAECKTNLTALLDSFHRYSINVTETYEGLWYNQYLQVASILGLEFNDSWFFCY